MSPTIWSGKFCQDEDDMIVFKWESCVSVDFLFWEFKDNNCPLRDVTPLRPQLKLVEYDMTMMRWWLNLYLYNWQSLKNAPKNREVQSSKFKSIRLCLIKLLSVSVQLREIKQNSATFIIVVFVGHCTHEYEYFQQKAHIGDGWTAFSLHSLGHNGSQCCW